MTDSSIWKAVVITCQTLILKSLFQGPDRPPLFPGFDEVIDNLGNYFDIILDISYFFKKCVFKNLGGWGSGCKWVGEAHSGYCAVLRLEESESEIVLKRKSETIGDETSFLWLKESENESTGEATFLYWNRLTHLE